MDCCYTKTEDNLKLEQCSWADIDLSQNESANSNGCIDCIWEIYLVIDLFHKNKKKETTGVILIQIKHK